MTVEARKLHFIEEFLKITDENVITQMEAIMREEKLKHRKEMLHPMTMDEFRMMIDKAKEDADNGRVTSNESLKREVQSW